MHELKDKIWIINMLVFSFQSTSIETDSKNLSNKSLKRPQNISFWEWKVLILQICRQTIDNKSHPQAEVGLSVSLSLGSLLKFGKISLIHLSVTLLSMLMKMMFYDYDPLCEKFESNWVSWELSILLQTGSKLPLWTHMEGFNQDHKEPQNCTLP